MNTLRSSAFELFQFFELTPDLVCITGKDGYFRQINQAVIDRLGYTKSELLATPVSSFIHPADREMTSLKRKDLLDGIPLTNFQNRYLTKTAKTIWLHWTSVYIPEREIVFAIAKDVTDRKQTEKEIEDNYQKFKALAFHFKTSLENDRRHLGSELHEELAQLAAVVRLDLDWIKNNETALSASTLNKVDHAMIVTDMLINSIRRISYAISPRMLETLGLAESLRCMLDEFSSLNNISCSLNSVADFESLPQDVKLDLYRICQESLNNVMNHADATAITVTLEKSDHEFIFQVEDNGTGNGISDDDNPAGLMGIKKRVASFNGTLHISSEPGKGTGIMVLIDPARMNH